MCKDNLSLQPANRVNFTDLFFMPQYEVESIVGTTYSLNFETLLMLILAVTYGPGANRAMGGTSDLISPAALFAAIENMRGRLKVYCQTDKTDMKLGGRRENSSIQRLKALLDDFVRPVPMIKDNEHFSSFHPKCWHILFKPTAESGKKYWKYRFAVTSRNLTTNRDFDATAVFEGSCSEPPDWAVPGGKDPIDALLELPENKKITVADLNGCHCVVSPFLDGDFLSELQKDISDLNIFSLRSEIDKVWKNHPELWENGKYTFYCFNPALEAQEDEASHRSIHAKLYIGENFTILGSSNFTYRGWNHNREFNVQLDRGIAKDDLLKQLGVDREDNYGKGLFVPYAPPEAPDKVEEKTEDPLLQQLAGVVLNAAWDGENLSLEIDNRLGADLNNVQWKPLWGNEWRGGSDLKWELAAEDVSRIFLCRVGENEIQMLAASLTCTCETKDLWKIRYAAERKKISPADELNFRMLQAEGVRNLYNHDVPLKRNSGGDTSHRAPQPPVFERMLKMNDEELKRFFKDDIPEWDEKDDPLGLGQALHELQIFFGNPGEQKK